MPTYIVIKCAKETDGESQKETGRA